MGPFRGDGSPLAGALLAFAAEDAEDREQALEHVVDAR